MPSMPDTIRDEESKDTESYQYKPTPLWFTDWSISMTVPLAASYAAGGTVKCRHSCEWPLY